MQEQKLYNFLPNSLNNVDSAEMVFMMRGLGKYCSCRGSGLAGTKGAYIDPEFIIIIV